MKIYGKNVLKERLITDPKSICKIYLSDSFKDDEILKLIKTNKIKYLTLHSRDLNKMFKNNQGIVATVTDFKYQTLDAIDNEKVVVMLDHIEDPHNLGAIIRTCEAAGIKNIIIPKDRASSVTETVIKTSVGAISYVNIIKVSNLVNAINYLKDKGFFIYGTSMHQKNYKDVNYASKVCLIIGNEGNGMSNVVSKNCDEIISLPQKGKINSLNASVAAGIFIYDIVDRIGNEL